MSLGVFRFFLSRLCGGQGADRDRLAIRLFLSRLCGGQAFTFLYSTFAAGNWEISLDVIGQGRHPVV